MRKLRSMVLLITVLAVVTLLASACGSEKPATETTKKTTDKSATSTTYPAETSQPGDDSGGAAADDSGGGAADEISKLVACELLPGATVEKITGGKLQVKPTNSGPICLYGVGAGDKIETYKVMYMPAGPNVEYLKAISDKEKGEKIDGPWKEAWLGKSALGSGFRIVVIFDDDISIEVNGDRKEVLAEMAKVAAEGLKK